MLFPMILLGILLVFGVVFYVVIKNQEKKGSINAKDKNRSSNSSSGTSKKANDEIRKEDVFKFMEFDRILDSMIVQKNGTKFTMAVKCKGINYDLMSDIEQLSVEEGFITFLNTLRYPIQLYVQAQNIDLKGAINTYKQNVNGIRDEYDRINDEYSRILDQFDVSETDLARTEVERTKVLNVYEYANDIINYVERLSLNKSLLQRNFYVLVSYNTSEISSIDNFNKDEIVDLCYNELLTRAQSIISGLSACSVSGTVLDSNEIADLLYTAYNRDDKGLLNVKEAIDSGFYRMYSTSEDAFYKKQQIMMEQINNEAKIKAIQAIQKAFDNGEYVSPEVQELVIQERISKNAAEMVKNENLPQDIKDAAKEILVEDYRNVKSNLAARAQARKNTNVEGTEVKEEIKENQPEKEDENNIEVNINDNNQYEKDKEDLEINKAPVEDIIVNKENNDDLVIENDDNVPDVEIEEPQIIPPSIPYEPKIPVINDDRMGSDSGDIFDDRLGSNSDTNDDDTSDDQIIR